MVRFASEKPTKHTNLTKGIITNNQSGHEVDATHQVSETRIAPKRIKDRFDFDIGAGPPPFRVLMNFTADGGFTASGDGDSAVGSPQYGVWERIGGKSSRTYAVTFRQLFYNPDSSSTGSARIQQTVVLNEPGDTWTGPGVVRIYAPDGTLVFTGTATATATRIVSEPLP